MTKTTDLLDDVLCYGGAAAVAQGISHALLGRNPLLPERWEELVARYTAGSAIVAVTLTVYAVRRPDASASEAAILHWGVLLASGAAVGMLHLLDYLREVHAARALDRAYEAEDRHVASPPPRPLRPVSVPRRAGP